MGKLKPINPTKAQIVANPQAAAHDYDNLTHKPQINGHELVGNKTGDELGLQGKLTAGKNVMIDENGRISASGGVTSYNYLTDKPSINGHELVGNKSSDDLGLQNKLTAGENITINANGEISASGGVTRYTELSDKPLIFTFNSEKTAVLQGFLRLSEEFFIKPSTGGIYLYLKNGSISFKLLANDLVERLLRRVPSSDPVNPDLNLWKYHRDFKNSIVVIDDNASEYQNLPVDTPCVVVTSLMQGEMNGFQLVFTRNDSQPRMFLRYKYSDSGTEYTDWREIGEKGDKGDKGDPGDAYVLTAQDKSDIANIVLSELPTTQGVQYGNTNN